MNKRQQKKLNKNEWHPLTMRVKLKNGKIRNRTWKPFGYHRYERILRGPVCVLGNVIDLHPEIPPAHTITIDEMSERFGKEWNNPIGRLALCGGHWGEIEEYRNAEFAQFGYNNGYPNRHLFRGLL